MLSQLPLPLFFLGLTALYIGERALAETARWLSDGVGLVALTVALGAAVGRWQAAAGARRRAHGWVALAYTLAILGVAAYGLARWAPPWLAGNAATLLQVAWPAWLLLALLPAIAMELAVSSMLQTPTLEIWRVRLAARSASIMGLAVIAFAGVNYTANMWNRKIDLSYFKISRASTATQAIVRNLTQPVQIVLFFPPGNEVLEQVRSYVGELSSASAELTVEVADQALEPERARALKVRSNGYLAVVCGERNEALRLDLDPEDARATLRNLDSEVQQRLLKVIRPTRVAYFTTGHNERDYTPGSDDKRPAMGDFKQLLEMQGFAVRRLGLAEGLGQEIPKDATLVAMLGPTEPCSPAERTALQHYFARGGRALLALDPDHGAVDNELVAPLGVAVSSALVATDRYGVRVEGRRESPYDMVTVRGNGSPIVATLEQNPGRLAVVLLGAGAITKVVPQPANTTVTLPLHAMPNSWLDKNNNGIFDAATETRGNWDLAATIERTWPSANPNTPAAAEPNAAAALPPSEVMRVVVVGDADFISNGVLRNPGNQYLVADIVRWLAGNEKAVGSTESETDIPLVHRKDEDALWFYGTALLFPAMVLIGGLTYTRRSGRARRR